VTRRNEPDPIADWFAIRFGNQDQLDDAPPLLEEFSRAEDCARLLHQLGKNSLSNSLHADRRQGQGEQPFVPQLDVGRFQILRLVGRGGMGNVFLAVDPVLQRKVAIKIPRLDLRSEPELRRRFLREARATAGLEHPNVVSILEVGEDGPSVFLVLAWCEGPDLGDWLERQSEPIAPRQAAELVAILAETLDYCHQQGVIHRDLKPSNILLEAGKNDAGDAGSNFPFVPKITDFGLARILEEGLEQTDSSLLLGTPHYMAPEQAECRHEDVGPHTDVYSLGVILYQLLTRTTPFQASTAIRVLDQIRHETPPAISQARRDVARDLRVICEKCIHKRPEDRYQTAAELAEDLRRFSRGETVLARPLSIRTRLDRWLRQPARFANAALVVIVVHAIIILWMGASIYVDVVKGEGLPLEYSAPVAVARVIIVAILVHGVPMALAVLIMRKRRWALLGATVMAALLFIWITSILFGNSPPFPGYDERPILKARVFWLLEALSLTQLVALLLALRAREK